MLVKRELLRQGQCLHSRGLEPWHEVARGPPVGALGGELFFPWGKLFIVATFVLLFPCVSLYSGLFMLVPFFLG